MGRKKIILIIFWVALVAVSCVKKEEKAITFAVGGAPNEIEFWDSLVKEFESERNIKVNISRQPTDTDQRRQGLVISLKSQEPDPDVFLMDVAWIAQFAASNWLETLAEYVKKGKINLEVFFGRVLNLADKYEGNLIALPVYVDGGLLYYREDLLEKYGYKRPPQTWRELVDYSLKVQEDMREIKPNFYGFVWQGAQYEGLICNFLEVAGSNNGGIILQDGKILLNLPENIEAARLMHNLIHNYQVSPPNTFTEMKEEEVRTFFEQGDALFERNWPYAWALHQNEGSEVKDKVGLALLPHFATGKSVSTLGGWHIGISKYSDAKAKSFEFIKFVVSSQTQRKLATELGWNPGRRDLYTDSEVLKKMPHFATLRNVFENAQPRLNLPYYTQISEVAQRYLNAILSGRLTPEVALREAEKESQKVVERYNKR
jgi:multiple sugar transport system substrate-binding protein